MSKRKFPKPFRVTKAAIRRKEKARSQLMHLRIFCRALSSSLSSLKSVAGFFGDGGDVLTASDRDIIAIRIVGCIQIAKSHKSFIRKILGGATACDIAMQRVLQCARRVKSGSIKPVDYSEETIDALHGLIQGECVAAERALGLSVDLREYGSDEE